MNSSFSSRRFASAALLGCTVFVISGAAGTAARAQVPISFASANGNSSTQTAAFGITPSNGAQQSLLTTINPAGSLPPGLGATPANTDVSALNSYFGLPTGTLAGLGAQDGSGYLSSPLFLSVGSAVRFDFVFLTDEDKTLPATPPPARFHDDLAFFTVNGALASTLFKASQLSAAQLDAGSNTIFSFQTAAYQTFTYTVPATANYTFGFGVIDVGANTTKSGLLIDNFNHSVAVPEPSSWALLLTAAGATLLIPGAWRRRRHPSGAPGASTAAGEPTTAAEGLT